MPSPAVSKEVLKFSVLTKRRNKDYKKKQAKNGNKTKPRVLKNKILSRVYIIKA